MPVISPATTEKANMNLTKQDCSDSIAQYIERTAIWRRSLAVKFAGDIRNARAAEALERLAVEAADLSDEQWGLLRPHFGGWASETWRDALGLAARQVGFAYRQRGFDSFVRLIALQFPQNEIAA
jgi:hypothetical protein